MTFFAPRLALPVAVLALSACPIPEKVGDNPTDASTADDPTSDLPDTTGPDPTGDTTDSAADDTTEGMMSDTGEPMEPPPVDCDISPGDHTAAVCSGGDCSITADVELRCDDNDFAAPGVRVAAGSAATWLATSSSTGAMLYRVETSAVSERITVPARFARETFHLATGPTGDLHIAAEVAINQTGDWGVAYLSEADGFAEQTVHDQGSAGSPIGGFQVMPDGDPSIIFFGDGPDDYQEATPDGGDGWQFAPVELADGGYGRGRFGRDAQGRLLAADIRESQGLYRLGVEVDGAMVLLGKSLNSLSASQHFVLAASASPTPPIGAPFAAILESAGAIEVAWPLDGDKSGAIKVPGLGLLDPTCFEQSDIDDDELCVTASCHEQGQGFEHATTSFTRTPDGLGWVVIVTTQQDFTYVYEKMCSEREGEGEVCGCPGRIEDDISSSTLHVFRVTFDDAPPVEVLTLPLARLEPAGAWAEFGDSLIATHAHAHADSLAIGLRLRGSEPGEIVVRALRVELPGLKR